MKIIMHGPLAGPGPHGGPALQSWGPDQEVEIDDKDKTAVAWARGWVAAGATLVEDAADDKKAEAKPAPAKAEARAAPAKASGDK